ASEHWLSYERGTIASGLAPLDALLGGGLTKGSSTLIIGPAGTGKSSLATQYIAAAAARGEHSNILLFGETPMTFRRPSAGTRIRRRPVARAAGDQCPPARSSRALARRVRTRRA